MFVLWMAGKVGTFPLHFSWQIRKWIEEGERAQSALSPYKIRMTQPMTDLSNKVKVCLQGA
jgi:hypothetical protein